ncbi:hypothetical protein A0O00_01275 [Proteus mirabilis]|nr:hypothetical protein A0O00_01275 [Proteus mirabilis]
MKKPAIAHAINDAIAAPLMPIKGTNTSDNTIFMKNAKIFLCAVSFILSVAINHFPDEINIKLKKIAIE